VTRVGKIHKIVTRFFGNNLLKTFLKHYGFLSILLCSIILGALVGYWFGPSAQKLKPFGDIFLNLIFTFVVPLVFFSVASAVANMRNTQQIFKILVSMLVTFIFTSLIAAVFMLVLVLVYPPAQGVTLHLPTISTASEQLTFSFANIITVSDFTKLFSRENMLSLIVFSILVGIATLIMGEKAKPFSQLLQSGTQVFMKVFSLIMYYAPIGFFAYFAVLVSELGPKLLQNYYRAFVLYYSAGILYFVIGFTCYAFIAGKLEGVKRFWKNCFVPSATAMATCSSAASIPANLEATQNMGVPDKINELVIPLGTIIHKDGSVLGGILKIAFLFGLYHLNFVSVDALMIAIMVSLLVGTVMGAIPSGGLVGEMLILSVYGFPPQTLIIIAAISILIDPLATMINVISNMLCSMLVARIVEGKNWINRCRVD